MRLVRAVLAAALGAALLPAATEPEVRAAATRSVALLQKVNAQWKTPCISCHHQTLGALALQSARQHGVAVDEKLALAASTRDYRLLADVDAALRGELLIDPAMFEGSVLMGAHAAGVRPSLATSILARHIARNQQPEGYWRIGDLRPPHSHSTVAATAIGARAVALFEQDPGPVVAKARRWLATARAEDTEGAAFRLLGLTWTGGSPAELRAAGTELLTLQRPDGGWRQNSRSSESDAYSTAESLYALRIAGVAKPDSPEFQRGIQWLLERQAPDGSWHVRTRLHAKAPISPPYFESGFPYGRDQFLSMAATAWGIRALAEALPDVAAAPAPKAPPAFDERSLGWARTALLGTPGEVAGIDPESATAGGTTALMFAAHDPEKVKVLLARGANAKAVSKTGHDALLIATLYRGNSRSVELLLAAGAPVQSPRKVRLDATPLFHALMSGDVGMARLLLSKGADPNRGTRLLAGAPIRPLVMAASIGNPEMIGTLVQGGAIVDAVDSNGMTALSWAALSHRTASVETLLSLGADRAHKDSFGLTPFGHTTAISDSPGDAAAALSR